VIDDLFVLNIVLNTDNFYCTV